MNIDLEKLLELAGKATPQHFDLAQMVTSDGLIECPCCSGSGEVELGNDYCNYDGAAIGVQFYGIGDAHVNAEEFYRAANPATVTELVNMVKGSTLACIADVQAEPEFPGDAPPELMKYIRQCIEAKDEQRLLHMMRMAVSTTKNGIQERIAARTGIAIEGIFGRVVRDQCSCGEPISVELDCPRRTIRTDKKRPFYPDEGLPDGLDPQNYSEHGSSVFRCRKCGEPVGETVPAAKYGEAK